MLLPNGTMSIPLQKPHMEKFFEHHLQAVAARLERCTNEALRRQHLAWRDALHRQAVLEEKESENFRDER